MSETTATRLVYRLRLVWRGTERFSDIEAWPDRCPLGDTQQEKADFDATTTAIARIMDRASEDPFWAHAKIELSRPDGTVIHTMESK